MNIRKDDDTEKLFVLAVGMAPTFKIIGWMKAIDARKKEWLQNYAGREPAWFAPQSELHDLRLLVEGEGERGEV